MPPTVPQTPAEVDALVSEALDNPAVLNTNDLAAAIVAAVNAAQGPRKIGVAEYLRTRSVHRGKPVLARKYYQNGILLQRDQLTADAIEMLNLIKPGAYADGSLQVVAVQDGTKFSAMDIRYNNKSVDERMQFKSKFPTFEHMLAAILKEAAV